MPETVYAIFDDQDHCCYLCYSDIDEENEYYDQVKPMTNEDWEEWLSND